MNVEDRLARLEHENRHLKAAGLLIIAIAASVLLMGQARQPAEVVAQRFTLVNGSGERIGELRMNDDGHPYLGLYAPGQTEAVIGMGLVTWAPIDGRPSRGIAGPHLSLSAVDTGRTAVSLTVSDSVPGVTLYDRNGKGRVTLSIYEEPNISIWNPQLNRPVWQAP